MKQAHNTLRLGTGACALVALFLVAGCSNGSSTDHGAVNRSSDAPNMSEAETNQRSTHRPSIAPTRTRPNWDAVAKTSWNGLQVEVNRVVSDSNGFTAVYWSFINKRDEAFYIGDIFQRKVRGWYMADYLSSIKIVSQSTGRKYFPLSDPELDCVCTKLGGAEFSDVPSGGRLQGYTTYYIPPEVNTVSIKFPKFDLLENIEVQ